MRFTNAVFDWLRVRLDGLSGERLAVWTVVLAIIGLGAFPIAMPVVAVAACPLVLAVVVDLICLPFKLASAAVTGVNESTPDWKKAARVPAAVGAVVLSLACVGLLLHGVSCFEVFGVMLLLPLIGFCLWVRMKGSQALRAEKELAAAEAADAAEKKAAAEAWEKAKADKKAAEEAARLAEEEANRPPTRAARRAAARKEYAEVLAEIDADQSLDPLERSGAKLAAKQRYLDRLDKGM